MKVYVITCGEHSDYGMLGISTSKEKAQAYVDKYRQVSRNSMNDLEEYELDALDADKLELIVKYIAEIAIKTGNLFQQSSNAYLGINTELKTAPDECYKDGGYLSWEKKSIIAVSYQSLDAAEQLAKKLLGEHLKGADIGSRAL